jgi:hypothetical protein
MVWAVVLFLLIAAVVGARFSYHWLKARRANQLAEQGESLAAAGKLNESAEKFRAALQLDPLGYAPLRGAARLATRVDHDEAFDLWEQVMRLPQSTLEDRQSFAELLVRTNRLKPAEKILTPLLQGNPDAKTLRIAADYARKTGDVAKAVSFARAALNRSPNDNTARVKLAELLALTTDPQQHEEARKILWDLVEKGGPGKSAALDALARAPDLTVEERERALQMLDATPSDRIAESLLAADLRIVLHPEQAQQIFDQTVARWNRGNTDELVALARWLNAHQQPERVLSLVPLDQAMQNNQLLLTRLDALASMQRWADIDTLLNDPSQTFDPYILESFRARTAQERNAPIDADAHWNHALSLAGGDPYKLRFVAAFAEQSHTPSVALKAYDQLTKFPEHSDYAFRRTQMLSARTGDINVQRSAAEKIATRAPEDPNAAAQLVYLNLLTNTEVEKNLDLAKGLVQRFPDRLSYRIAAAVGYLRMHDPAQALAQVKGPPGSPPIDWEKTPPNWRAVYAATLNANEQQDAARQIIATIPKDRLTAEERALIDTQ